MQRSGAETIGQMSGDIAAIADQGGRAHRMLNSWQPLTAEKFGKGNLRWLDVRAVLEFTEEVIKSGFGILLCPESGTAALAALHSLHQLPSTAGAFVKWPAFHPEAFATIHASLGTVFTQLVDELPGLHAGWLTDVSPH
jgi:hypothetical protein